MEPNTVEEYIALNGEEGVLDWLMTHAPVPTPGDFVITEGLNYLEEMWQGRAESVVYTDPQPSTSNPTQDAGFEDFLKYCTFTQEEDMDYNITPEIEEDMDYNITPEIEEDMDYNITPEMENEFLTEFLKEAGANPETMAEWVKSLGEINTDEVNITFIHLISFQLNLIYYHN